MKKIISKSLLLLSFVACATLFSFKTHYDGVKGWVLRGSYPEGYLVGVEQNTARGGNVAYMKSVKSIRRGNFGTLMQDFVADKYVGKRIKLSGYIKCVDVKEWAGLWLRIDGEPRSKLLGFDNMHDRPIKGNTDWKRYEIVLDVPPNALYIAYGVLMNGTGTVWMDDLNIEIVKSDVNTTGAGYKDVPNNTSFEESEK